VFKNQCRSLFALRPQDYPTDTIKIESMGTVLSGAAAEWFYTAHQDWKDYESFVLHLNSCLVLWIRLGLQTKESDHVSNRPM
jgi:hypothetical protein